MLATTLCEVGIQFDDDFIEWSVSFAQQGFRHPVTWPNSSPPIDQERQVRARRVLAGAAVVVAAAGVVTGCSKVVDGTAAREGAGPRNNDSQQTYPNLLKGATS